MGRGISIHVQGKAVQPGKEEGANPGRWTVQVRNHIQVKGKKEEREDFFLKGECLIQKQL